VKGISGDWNVQWPAPIEVSPMDGSGMGVVLEGKGEPLLPDALRQQLEGVAIDVVAGDARRDRGVQLRRDEEGVEHLVVPNRQPLKSGNTLEPGTGAEATFTFEVPETGHYNLFALINAPTIEDDS